MDRRRFLKGLLGWTGALMLPKLPNARAMGVSYLVGESGPVCVVPTKVGYTCPAGQTIKSVSVDWGNLPDKTITITTVYSSKHVADEVSKALARQLRTAWRRL